MSDTKKSCSSKNHIKGFTNADCIDLKNKN